MSDDERERLKRRLDELSGPYYKHWWRRMGGYGDEVKSILLRLAFDEIDRERALVGGETPDGTT